MEPTDHIGEVATDDHLAADLRGFGPVGLVAVLVILAGNLLFVPLSGLLVLMWARASQTSWRALGFARPANWAATVLGGVAFGVVLKLVMKALVMPLLGADPINHAYHYIAGNPAALPGILFLVTAGAGFGEETVFRGYFFERAGRLVGRGTAARVATVAVTAIFFGLLHYPDQGLAGTEQATIVGAVFGAILARTGSLWFLMVAHSAFDLTAVALIYAELETTVAHFLLR